MDTLDRFSLKGRVALVTGGGGLYGREEVAAIAEAGATTYVGDFNIDAAEKVAAENRTLEFDVTAIQYDQSAEQSILSMRDTILARSGQIDILVNNAVLRPMKSFQDDASTFAESMKVNATGLFMITRAIGDVMAERGSGSIINIGSIMGLIGLDPYNYRGTDMYGWVPEYFFHKGGMVNFTRFIGSYYGLRGIRCNCVCPGGHQVATHPEAFVRQYSEHTFLGRMANETDMKGPIVFLASDASAYITGAIIPVDGGYVAR